MFLLDAIDLEADPTVITVTQQQPSKPKPHARRPRKTL